MSVQPVLIRGGLLLALSLGLPFAVLHNDVTTASAASAATPNPGTRAPAPVVLPTISVRPSAEEIALAMRGDDAATEATGGFVEVSQPRVAGEAPVSLHSVHLGMPYYSFGKALPHLSKE
ncbi:MAG TPA: hypothetical protein VFB32_01680 [Rudaea sp.]|nr:hypothetical protein [Rudaea sp.]